MLEILIIYVCGKKVGEIAGEKGYSGILFTILFIACWFIGEVLGGVIGFLLFGEGCAVYILALFLAIGGGLCAFLVAVILPAQQDERLRPRRKRRKPRRPIEVEDDSYREKVRPRERVVDVEDLEVVEDDSADEKQVKPAPRRQAIRKPDPNRDRDRYRSGDR